MLHFVHTVAVTTAGVISIAIPFAAVIGAAWLIGTSIRHRIRVRAQRRTFLAQVRTARPLYVIEPTDEAFEAELAALLNREGGR